MFPIKTAESNFAMLGPSPDVADLPCRVEGRGTFSIWEFTARERELIAQGANLRLGIHGAWPVPPVSVEICANDGGRRRLPQACAVCGSEIDHACHGAGPECHAFRTHNHARKEAGWVSPISQLDV